MIAIGIDTHKATLAACAVDELGQPLAERTFANDPVGLRVLLAWADEILPGARIGLEGSDRARRGRGPLPVRRRARGPGGPAPAQSPRTAANPTGRQDRSGRRPRHRPGDRS
jgi:hypothetical protein